MKVEMKDGIGDPTTSKNDPKYIDATIRQLPSLDDPRERRIIEVMKDKILSSPASADTFKRLKQVVIDNWQDAFSHLDDPDYVHDVTQKGLAEAAEVAKSTIVSGEENLKELKKKSPVMIVSNHLGTFKLISMNPEELKERGIDHKVPNIYYPYLTYYMPFYPAAEVLEDNVYEASFEEPAKLGELFRAAGSIDVPPPEVILERTSALARWTRELIDKHHNAALVVFPEGGTTGKRSGGAIYDLAEFKTGAFVIAAQVGISILPIAQYFNTDRSGFDLAVFEPFSLEPDKPKEYYQEAASKVGQEMQAWLDTKKSS